MKTLRFIPFRSLLFGAVICGTALQGSAIAEADSGVEWKKDGAAVLESKQERPILLRFTAGWCGPCRAMDANVWPDAKVAKMVNEQFIPVELDVDRPEVQDIARKFGIIAVPTIILLDGNGKELDRTNFMDVKQTLEFLEKASKE